MTLSIIMPTISKTSAKRKTDRRVKVSVKRVGREQTEAARIEAYLLREGFIPIPAKEKARLKRAGYLGMPEE